MDLKSDNDWFDDNFNVEKLLKQAKEVYQVQRSLRYPSLRMPLHW